MADVSVDLELNAKQAKSELSSFDGTLKSFAGSVKSALGGFAAGFAGAFSVGAIKDVITNTIHYASTIQDLSDKYHVSTTFLQRYGLAAEKAGASQESLAKGLKFLEINISKALAGGENSDAFKKFDALGISFDQLKSSKPEQVFELVAKAGGDAAENTAVLGKNALELQGLFDSIADGSAKLNNIVISPENVARLDAMEDQFLAIKAAGTALAATIIGEIVPAIQKFHEWANEKTFGALERNFGKSSEIPQGAAAAAPEDTALEAIARRHREEAGLPFTPDTAGVAPDKESPWNPNDPEDELDVIGADRDSKLDRANEAREEREQEEKDSAKAAKDAASTKEKLDHQAFLNSQREEVRNPGGLTLESAAKEGRGTVQAKAQEALREEAAAKRDALVGDNQRALGHRNRAEQLKKELGLKEQKDEFKEALDDSKLLAKIAANTEGAGANK